MGKRSMQTITKGQDAGIRQKRLEEIDKAEAALIEREKMHEKLLETTNKKRQEKIDKEIEHEWKKYIDRSHKIKSSQNASKTGNIEHRKAKFLETRNVAGKKILSMSNGVQVPTEDSMKLKYRLEFSRVDIAFGAIANLYKGKLDAKDVAVKVVTVQKLLQKKIRDQYMEGLKILMYMKETVVHKNVVKIFDVFNTPEKNYVIMELVVGKNLLTQYNDGSFPKNDENLSYKLFKEICEGVFYLHSIGVAHTKLRPSHIITNEHGTVKITGMGESVVYWNGEKVIPQKGSSTQKFHHFYSPERMKDKDYDPAAADIWALGTLLVTLLVRQWPFEPERSRLAYDIQWKMVFSVQELIRSHRTNKVLDTCFVVEPKHRGNILMVLSHMDD